MPYGDMSETKDPEDQRPRRRGAVQAASPRRIILTHWNAGAFQQSSLPHLLPELVMYALLYDEVLIREEDLLTNRSITRLLDDPQHLRVFEELLTQGLVKLLRLPVEAYPSGRRFDPVRLPISARAEEHQLRRSYKGSPWRPTRAEDQLFRKLDGVVSGHPDASQFHAPFPLGNPFAMELAELLENPDKYGLASHPAFRYIDPKTADEFIKFCREPDAWQRFLRDSGAKSIIVGPDGGFYRTAAYQCLRRLPTPRSIQRLVESVYAATYCDREASSGRYGGSALVELPYHYETEEERRATAETMTRIELVPTNAAASIVVAPGISTVLARTRDSPEFARLRLTLEQLGTATSDDSLPSEASFRDAWFNLAELYASHWAAVFVRSSLVDKQVSRYAVYAWVLARVWGFLILPHGPLGLDTPVALDAALIAAIHNWGPSFIKGVRAQLKMPTVRDGLVGVPEVRCSRVSLNKRPE